MKDTLDETRDNLKEIDDTALITLFPRHNGLSEVDIDTAHFIFWIIYDLERRLKETARMAMTVNRSENDTKTVGQFVGDTFDEMTLTGKINLLEKNLSRENNLKNYPKLMSVLRELNNVRNTLFHQRINIRDITYKGKKISNRTTKDKVILDLIEAFGGDGQKPTTKQSGNKGKKK